MNAPVDDPENSPENGKTARLPAAPGRSASRAGLWGALLGAAAAAGALLALRPAPGGGGGGALALQGADGAAALRRDMAPERGSPPSRRDPNHLGHDGGTDRQHKTEHAERRPASKRIIVGYGFWIFLLSDIIMFAAFFAS